MKKIIVVSSVLLITVLVLAHLYFSNISTGNRNIDNALAVIPNDASLIFEFTNDKGFYEIFSDYELFNAIIGVQKQSELAELKALLNNKNLLKLTEDQLMFLSFHVDKSDSISFLWTIPLNFKYSIQDVQNQLKRNKTINSSVTTVDKIQLLELYFVGLRKTFYLFTDNKLAIGSFSKSLLLKSLDKSIPKITKEFITPINTVNLKNNQSPANIFLNYTTLQSFLNPFFQQNQVSKFNLLSNLKGIASLNLSFRSDALLLNGVSSIDTLERNYLNIFLHQKPIVTNINRILPENTAHFVEYGVSNYSIFQKDLKTLFSKRHEIEKLESTLVDIKTESGIDLEREVKNLWGNEFITFQLSTLEKIGAIKIANGQKLQFSLEPISTFYSENIRRFSNPDLLYYYFGDPFKVFQKPYFTIIDNKLIVANSPGTLQRFIENYTNEKFLYKTSEFIAFKQLIADQTNVMLFIHLTNSKSYMKSFLDRNISTAFNSNDFGLKNFYGISYQWASNQDHFLTNFYTSYKQEFLNKEIVNDLDTIN